MIVLFLVDQHEIYWENINQQQKVAGMPNFENPSSRVKCISCCEPWATKLQKLSEIARALDKTDKRHLIAFYETFMRYLDSLETIK